MTSCGMSAIAAVLLTFLRSGDHLVHSVPLYGGTETLIARTLPEFGMERLIALSDLIWEMPELLYQEIRSVAEHTAELEHRLCRQELRRLLPNLLLKL